MVLGIGSLLNRSRPRFHIWGTGYMNQHERAKGGILGRDADLVVMVDCQIPSDDLIVHFF